MFREVERLRQRVNYRMQSRKQRARHNELARIRMANKRSRDKEQEQNRKVLRSNKEEEQQRLEEKRKLWRESKKKYRDKKKNEKKAASISPIKYASTPQKSTLDTHDALKDSPSSSSSSTSISSSSSECSESPESPKAKRFTCKLMLRPPPDSSSSESGSSSDLESESSSSGKAQATKAGSHPPSSKPKAHSPPPSPKPYPTPKCKPIQCTPPTNVHNSAPDRPTPLGRSTSQPVTTTEKRAASAGATDRRSTSAKRQARYRLSKGQSPKSPSRLLDALTDLYIKATPRRKKALQSVMKSPHTSQVQNAVIDTLKTQFQKTKNSNGKEAIRTRLFCAQVANGANARKELGLERSRTYDKADGSPTKAFLRKKRSDAFTDEDESRIKDFLTHNSTVVANTKRVKKNLKERRVLTDSMRNLLKKYNEKNAENQVGMTKFSQMRKELDLLLQDQGKYIQCLCEICANFKLMLNSLKEKYAELNIDAPFHISIHGFLEHMLCCTDLSDYHYDCCLGKHEDCGAIDFQSLDEHLDVTICYETWDSADDSKKKKIQVTDTLKGITQKICDQAHMLAIHRFDAGWQYQQFVNAKETLSEGEVLMVLDFAENYRTQNQMEVQSAHWAYNQVTIHPFAMYYLCPECQELISEAVVIISDNLQHDNHAVKYYTEMAIKYLTETRNLKVTKITQFTDGCAQQYKSCKAFHDVSTMQIPTTRSFFGSRHGKGPADGIASIVKSAATRAVKSGRVSIPSAQALFDFCEQELTTSQTEKHEHNTQIRKFLFVPATAVPVEKVEAETLSGTQQLHCVQSTGKDGRLKVRILSCHCLACTDKEDEDGCANIAVCGSWQIADVNKKNEKLYLPNLEKRQGLFLKALRSRKPRKPKKKKAVTKKTKGNKSRSRKSKKKIVAKKTIRNKSTSKITSKVSIRSQVCQKNTKKKASKKPPKAKSTKQAGNQEGSNSQNDHATDHAAQLITLFSNHAKKLRRAKSFKALQTVVEDITPLPELLPAVGNLNFSQFHLDKDEVATELVPEEHRDKSPVEIWPDGNCFSSCLSLLQYGYQNRAEEMRVRLTCELVNNMQRYLDAEYMDRGFNKIQEKKHYINHLTMYCEDGENNEDRFKKHIMKTRKDGEEVGIFHLAAAANILRRPIYSVYPTFAGHTTRGDVDRVFLPTSTDKPQCSTAHIMWTSTTGKEEKPKDWKPNHFVVLLPDERLVHK